jgi:hypothetical protein
METFSKNPIQKTWRRFSRINLKDLLVLTPVEATRLSWAKDVNSYQEIPEPFREELATLGIAEVNFDYGVITPSFEGFLKPDTEKLIFWLDTTLYVLEKSKNRILTTRYPQEDISYVERGSILLKAWIDINGIDSVGIQSTTHLRFNAVTESLFDPILQKIRCADGHKPPANLPAERAYFGYLRDLNYKFMQLARRTLLPGEQVIASLLQPEIRSVVVKIFGKSIFHTLATTHLSILTNGEFISIREGDNHTWSEDTHYGAIWTYLRLDKILSAMMDPVQDGLLKLVIRLPGDRQIELLYAGERYEEVEELVILMNHEFARYR